MEAPGQGNGRSGALCILGVDNDPVLKDFIRVHVEFLNGEKVCISHWYPDYVHDGKTIRAYYRTSPLQHKTLSLLPHGLYRRLVARKDRSYSRVHDALSAFFRAHRVDVVLAEFGPSGAAIAPHLQELGIPLVVHFHGHDAHRTSVVGPLRESYRAMFGSAFGIVSVSNYMTKALIELGADPAKILTNPYGPRERFFDNHPDYARPAFLSLGRFTDIKANYLTLMAFAQVLEACPEATLTMAGDGELLETCKTLAKIWGVQDSVTFTGAVPHSEILRLMSGASMFVQHSVHPSYGDAEGTPVVILEAQAAGLPVVATRHAGITDAVEHGATGYLVDELDVHGMAQHMLHLANSADLRRQMGSEARTHIRRNFSCSSHVAKLQGLIDAARAS